MMTKAMVAERYVEITLDSKNTKIHLGQSFPPLVGFDFWFSTGYKMHFRASNGMMVTKLAWTSTNVLVDQLFVERIRFVPVCTVVLLVLTPTMLVLKNSKYESVHSSS